MKQKNKNVERKELQNEKRVVFFNGTSWYHRTKELLDDMTMKYGKKGGFATPEEAEKSYWEYEECYKDRQRELQVAHLKNTDVMFGEFLRYWFEHIYSLRIETTTKMIGAYTLYNLLLPNMEADIKLKYVTVEYLDTLLERASKICVSAGNKGRELLSLAMKDAVFDGFIKYNPVPETKSYPRPKPKIRILSKEKIKVLLHAAYLNPWYLEMLLALFCGLRKGEIMGLKFSDFDFEKRTVRISRQLVANPKLKDGYHVEEYGVTERDPKTENSFRILRVPKAVMEEVERRRQKIETEKAWRKDFYEDHGYVCCRPDGKPHSTSAFNLALTKLCERNGLPKITVHGLRHMFATILIERGVPLVKISGLLGHSSIHTTYEYYCEVMDEKDKIIAFMNDTFVPEKTGTEG